MGVFKVGLFVLDLISNDFILLDRAVPEIICFKHDVEASNVKKINKFYR